LDSFDNKEILFQYHSCFFNSKSSFLFSSVCCLILVLRSRISFSLPKYHEFYVEDTGKLEEKSIDPADHKRSLVRIVETGVTLNLNSAKSIHKWLGEKIDELEKLMNQIKDLEKPQKNG
jgi:hypothetical protein